MKKKILLLMLVLVSFLGIAIPSQAETGTPILNERDTRVFGLLPKNQNNSLRWTQLNLTCNVFDVSSDNYFYRTSNEAKGIYQIQNTENHSVTEEFVLPYYELENSLDYKLQKTSITVNDEKINPKIRHSYSVSGSEFYDFKELPLYEEYRFTEKYNKDTNVHKITGKIDVSNLKNNSSFQFEVKVKAESETTIVAKNLKTMEREREGNYALVFNVNKNNPTFELCFIGKIPEFTIKEYDNLFVEETNGNLLSFANFQLPEHISLIDWFNIIVQRLIYLDERFITYEELTSTDSVLSYLVFSVNFDALKSVTIETSTPFYALGSDKTFHLSGYLYKEIKYKYVEVKGSYDVLSFYGGPLAEEGYRILDFEFEIKLDSTFIDLAVDIGLMVIGGILTFFLYFIPMIIMLVLFIRRRDKKGFVVLYIQKFLSYSLCFFGFLFSIISDSDIVAGVVLLCFFGILTISTLIQNIKNNCKDFGRLILETLCWVLIIYNVSYGDIFVIFITLMIFCFIEFIFVISKIRKMKSIDPSLPKNCLPVGILYPAEYWIIYAYFAVSLSVCYIVSEVINQMWFFIIALVVILICYFIGMILRYKYFFLKPFRKFYKDLDLDALEQSVQKRQALPNVHPETINLYNILMVQHSLSHSKEKGREYFKKTYLPKTKGYVLQYRGLLLRYGLTKEEFDNAYEVLKREFYNKKAVLKSFERFYNFWSPYYGTNPTIDISKIYKVNRKNNAYQNAISLFLLIYYYNNQKNTSKVRELKGEFLKKYSNLTEFVNDLNEL